MNSRLAMLARLVPASLYARIFCSQLALLTLVTAIFMVFLAVDQTRSAMRNVADVWAPALQDALSRGSQDSGEKTVTVSRAVELLYGAPPQNAYLPNRTHLRWQALQEALRDHGVPVSRLAVAGPTGAAVIWLDTGGMTQPRWIGVRSNLEGTDFVWRWAIAMALSVASIALAAWWLARRIVAPLRTLESAVSAFSAGQPFVAATGKGPREIRALASAFEHMARERADLDAQRALMLAGISHDIRSPLARIRMAAELLPDHGDAAALSRRIANNVAIADALVESFSDYVRAESEPMLEPIELGALAATALQAAGLAPVSLHAPNAVWVVGSAHLLQRALINLIDNAKKHGKPPIRIDVMPASTPGGDACIRVSDCGAGIAPQERERLMRPFERGAVDRGTPGSGLGLAIAARAVRRHGGRLEIDAGPEGGARFTINLKAGGSSAQ